MVIWQVSGRKLSRPNLILSTGSCLEVLTITARNLKDFLGRDCQDKLLNTERRTAKEQIAAIVCIL
jgi:hypothetical protein